MDLKEEFIKAEQSIGINKDNFHQKFIYDAASNADNYLLAMTK